MPGDDESRLLLLFVQCYGLVGLDRILLCRLYYGISLVWFEESDTKQKTISSKNNILCKLSQMGASSVSFLVLFHISRNIQYFFLFIFGSFTFVTIGWLSIDRKWERDGDGIGKGQRART